MYARARYKLVIDDKVIQAGRFNDKSTQEEQEEFLVSFSLLTFVPVTSAERPCPPLDLLQE